MNAYDTFVQQVLDLLDARSPRKTPALPGSLRPHLLCIDGPSGAGKSTLAAAVAAAAQRAGVTTSMVATDELLDGWHGLPEMPAVLERQIVRRIDEGRLLHHRRYDWTAHHFTTPRAVTPAALYILEGVGSGARVLAARTDLLIWVDAAARTRRSRALARDGDAYVPWFDVWARAEQEHHLTEGTAERADLVLRT